MLTGLILVLSNTLQHIALFYFRISDRDPSYQKQKVEGQSISESSRVKYKFSLKMQADMIKA